jgi:pectate lyase
MVSANYNLFILSFSALFILTSARPQGNDLTGARPQGNGLPTPFGYASETTGGGNAAPDTPKTIEELESLLKDKKPRVILIDRTFDFTNSKGNKTEKGW